MDRSFDQSRKLSLSSSLMPPRRCCGCTLYNCFTTFAWITFFADLLLIGFSLFNVIFTYGASYNPLIMFFIGLVLIFNNIYGNWALRKDDSANHIYGYMAFLLFLVEALLFCSTYSFISVPMAQEYIEENWFVVKNTVIPFTTLLNAKRTLKSNFILQGIIGYLVALCHMPSLYRSWRDIGGTVRMIRSRFAILGPHLFGVLVLSIAGIVQATNATTLSTFALASDVSAPIATLVFLGLALCFTILVIILGFLWGPSFHLFATVEILFTPITLPLFILGAVTMAKGANVETFIFSNWDLISQLVSPDFADQMEDKYSVSTRFQLQSTGWITLLASFILILMLVLAYRATYVLQYKQQPIRSKPRDRPTNYGAIVTQGVEDQAIGRRLDAGALSETEDARYYEYRTSDAEGHDEVKGDEEFVEGNLEEKPARSQPLPGSQASLSTVSLSSQPNLTEAASPFSEATSDYPDMTGASRHRMPSSAEFDLKVGQKAKQWIKAQASHKWVKTRDYWKTWRDGVKEELSKQRWVYCTLLILVLAAVIALAVALGVLQHEARCGAILASSGVTKRLFTKQVLLQPEDRVLSLMHYVPLGSLNVQYGHAPDMDPFQNEMSSFPPAGDTDAVQQRVTRSVLQTQVETPTEAFGAGYSLRRRALETKALNTPRFPAHRETGVPRSTEYGPSFAGPYSLPPSLDEDLFITLTATIYSLDDTLPELTQDSDLAESSCMMAEVDINIPGSANLTVAMTSDLVFMTLTGRIPGDLLVTADVAPVLLHSLSVEGGLIATSTSGDITLQKVVAHGISLTSEEGTLELVHTTSGVEVYNSTSQDYTLFIDGDLDLVTRGNGYIIVSRGLDGNSLSCSTEDGDIIMVDCASTFAFSLDFVSTTGDILLNSLLLSGGNYTTASTQEGSISASASTMNFFDASAPYGGIFLAEVFFGVPTPSDDLFLVHVPNYTDPGMSLRARDGGIQILGFGGSPAGNFGGAMTIELSTFIGDIEVQVNGGGFSGDYNICPSTDGNIILEVDGLAEAPQGKIDSLDLPLFQQGAAAGNSTMLVDSSYGNCMVSFLPSPV